MTAEALIQHSQGMYKRTYHLWHRLKDQYPTWKCRYSILYSPPVFEPDLVILGLNPGYNPHDLYDDEIHTWPSSNEYIHKDWPLARKLRAIFSNAGLSQNLKNSVGSNLLFFKSRSKQKHESGLGWSDNPSAIRKILEDHCKQELFDFIRLARPRAILALGFPVFDQLVRQQEKCIEKQNRRLVASGQAYGVKLLGIIHPTGARVSSHDWKQVSHFLASEIGKSPVSIPGQNSPLQPKPIRIEEKSLHPKKKIENPSSRQSPFRPNTIVEASTQPPSDFGYQPFQDFWQMLCSTGPISVEDFHRHMVSTGWRRPQGKDLTYEVTRIDIASMCKHGFVRRLKD